MKVTMSEIKEVAIRLSDLEDARQILNACVNYFTAQDLSDAQRKLEMYKRSPLTAELERVKERMDGYLGDFLLAQYEEEHGHVPEDDLELEVEVEVVEEEEPLGDNPLGTVKVNRQKGRRLTKEELTPKEESEDG